MNASFIITFASPRLDNLRQTLRYLYRNHAEVIKKCELITVCQDNCEVASQGFGTHLHYNLETECMQLPRLTNFGVDHAHYQKIIVLESDRILPTGYYAEILQQLKAGIQITPKLVWKLDHPYSDEEIAENKFKYTEDARTANNQIGTRNMWSGNTAFMKTDFETAGKMDENYQGYGWADSDMTNAMTAAGIKSIFRPEIELHLWHPATTYGKGNQKQMFLKNGLRFCDKWNEPLPEWFRQELTQHSKSVL